MSPTQWRFHSLSQVDLQTEPLILEAGDEAFPEKSVLVPTTTPSRRVRSSLLLLLSTNLTWMTILLLALYRFQYTQDRCRSGVNTAIFGHIPHQNVLFDPDSDHKKGLDASAMWQGLHESFDGFVNIQNPERYGLTGGYPFPLEQPTGEIYCISAFHQLHCLAGIREALKNRSNITDDPMAEAHLSHCLSYLRQAIMCSGDLTLEKTIWELGGVQQFGATGWGNIHECKNWDAIMAFSKEHRHSIAGYNQVKAESDQLD